MGATFSRVKTWIAEVLTASDLNGEFDNILNNFTPAGMDDASVNLAAMRTQRDVTGASLATDGAEEFHGLRFQLDAIVGKDYWYEAADTSLLLEFNKGADIASGSALALGTDGNYFDVTGTTTITSIDTRRVGSVVRLHFDGVLQLTHHATDLVLPGGANITTIAGDEAVFIEYATGDWRMVNYEPYLSAATTGTGSKVRATSPTIVTPTIADLTNMTHDHADATGGGTIGQSGIAASAVGQGELKSTTGAVSTTATRASLTLPGGEYGFYPQIKMEDTTDQDWVAGIVSNDIAIGTVDTQAGWTSYTTEIQLGAESSKEIFAQQRYIQASPPYKIGDIQWGHFIFVLRNISTGVVISSYEAEDPCWAYNGNPNYAKNDVKRIQEVPHPFIDYWTKDPAADGLEVVLLDLRSFDMPKFKTDSRKAGKSILENMKGNIIIPSQKKTRQSLGVPEIIGFTDKVIFR